jgi:hypothetical protein
MKSVPLIIQNTVEFIASWPFSQHSQTRSVALFGYCSFELRDRIWHLQLADPFLPWLWRCVDLGEKKLSSRSVVSGSRATCMVWSKLLSFFFALWSVAQTDTYCATHYCHGGAGIGFYLIIAILLIGLLFVILGAVITGQIMKYSLKSRERRAERGIVERRASKPAIALRLLIAFFLGLLFYYIAAIVTSLSVLYWLPRTSVQKCDDLILHHHHLSLFYGHSRLNQGRSREMFLLHEGKPLLREKRTLTYCIHSEERHEGSLKQGCICDRTVGGQSASSYERHLWSGL